MNLLILIQFFEKKYYESALHPNFKPGRVISEKVEKKELGMKTGKGLYVWNGKTPPEVNRTEKANLLSLDLLLALQANEGCRLLEEGVVNDWTTIDKTMRDGFNSLGPISILADGNDEKWVTSLEDFAQNTKITYLQPCEMMKSGKYKEFQFS